MVSRHESLNYENPDWLQQAKREGRTLGNRDIAQILVEGVVVSAEQAGVGKIREIRDNIFGDFDCQLMGRVVDDAAMRIVFKFSVSVLFDSIPSIRQMVIGGLDKFLALSDSEQRSFAQRLLQNQKPQRP